MSELLDARLALEQKNALQRALDREVVELRTLLKEADRQLATVRGTLSYRLGAAIVDARTWRGMKKLPRRLVDLWLGQRLKRARGAVSAAQLRSSDRLRFVEQVVARLEGSGPDEAVAFAMALPAKQAKEKARALVELAFACRDTRPDLTLQLAESALQLNPSEGRLRALAFQCYDEGEVRVPAKIVGGAAAEIFTTEAQRRRVSAIQSDAQELEQPLRITWSPSAARPGPPRLAVVSDRALPHHADAATYRVQHVLGSAIEAGYEALLITPPGYRYPAKGDGRPIAQRSPAGFDRLLLPQVDCSDADVARFVTQTEAMLVAELTERKATCVYISAEPVWAIAAARAAARLGLPYLYDLSSIPAGGHERQSDWAETERFAATASRLRTCISGAAAVVARSRALAESAIDLRLIDPECVHRLVRLNDTVPEAFVRSGEAAQRDLRRELGIAEAQRLIGIVALTDCYDTQSLQHVVSALPRILERHPQTLLVFCGSTRMGQIVRRCAATLGCSQSVLVPDGFVRQRLGQYISTFSLMLFPRMIDSGPGLSAPFELQAAIALGTPILAVDSAHAREWIDGSVNGAIADRGEGALEAALLETLSDPMLIALEPEAGTPTGDKSQRSLIDILQQVAASAHPTAAAA